MVSSKVGPHDDISGTRFFFLLRASHAAASVSHPALCVGRVSFNPVSSTMTGEEGWAVAVPQSHPQQPWMCRLLGRAGHLSATQTSALSLGASSSGGGAFSRKMLLVAAECRQVMTQVVSFSASCGQFWTFRLSLLPATFMELTVLGHVV